MAAGVNKKSMLTGRHIPQVRAVYRTFWEKVRRATGGAAKALDANWPDVQAGDDGLAVSTGALELTGAKSRPGARAKRRYRILVESQSIVDGVGDVNHPQFFLAGCVVRVLWFPQDVTGDAAQKSLLGIHFDLASDDHHPVFHAQIDDAAIAPSVAGEYFKSGKKFETPRIPTAPMDLCGTVYMLLHDHFADTVMAGWTPECARAVEGMPRLPCAPIIERLKEQARLDCAHWYPQHRAGYTGRPNSGV